MKYPNNQIEADHGKLKWRIRPTTGFKSMKTVYATIQGFEAMRSLKQGQARAFQCPKGVRHVERCFNLGGSPIADVIQLLDKAIREQVSSNKKQRARCALPSK